MEWLVSRLTGSVPVTVHKFGVSQLLFRQCQGGEYRMMVLYAMASSMPYTISPELRDKAALLALCGTLFGLFRGKFNKYKSGRESHKKLKTWNTIWGWDGYSSKGVVGSVRLA